MLRNGFKILKTSCLTLPFLLAGLSNPTYAQSVPDWKSYTQTHNVQDIVSSLEVAAWLGKKLDVTQKGAENGVAPLDAYKNVTSPLLNNVRVGGSDNGTDITNALSNGVPLKSAINECQTDGATVYYGAANSTPEMGDLANTANLRATGNVLPYMNVRGLAAGIQNIAGATTAVGGPVGLSGMQEVIRNIGSDGIGEGWFTKYLTPNVNPSEFSGSLEDTSGNPVDDAAVFNDTGFQPSIMMMNIAEHTTDASQFSDADVHAFETALTDVPNVVKSVKYVWPYTNKQVTDTTRDFATDPYYANTRAILQKAGGVGLDMPAGLAVLNGEDSIKWAIETIKYAHAHGLRTLVLLSPYGINEGDGYDGAITPQWRHDSHFLDHVRMLISWLKEEDALPSAWAVVNYSPVQYWDPVGNTFSSSKDAKHTVLVTANTMGSDTDSADQSVAYVARWVAENAPTSVSVKMPSGILNQGKSAVCAATTLAGNSAMKPSLGANTIGLGSMAFQDSNNAYMTYPAIQGAQLRDTFNALEGTQITFGFSEVANAQNYATLQYDQPSQALAVKGSLSVTHNMNVAQDLHVTGDVYPRNLTFKETAGTQYVNTGGIDSWIIGDGQGGINVLTHHIASGATTSQLGPILNIGSTINAYGDITSDHNLLFLSGTNGIDFRKPGGIDSWITGDGQSGINVLTPHPTSATTSQLGKSLNIGSAINAYEDITSTNDLVFLSGTNGISFRKPGSVDGAWINGDGLGGIKIGSALNISAGTNGTATFNNGLSLANTSGTQATVGLDTSGNTVFTSKSGIGIVTTNADTSKVENGNVDLDNSQIVSDSTGNLGLQTVRVGGLSSPQYVAAPNKGTQGMIIHGADDYHTINIGYNIADAFGNLTYAPNTESHLLYGSASHPALIDLWYTDGQNLENLGQIAQADTIFNTHNFHIGRNDAVTGAANLLFHSAGTNIPSGVIAVNGGTSTAYQGAFTLIGKSFSFHAPVSTTATIPQNDNSNTLVTSAWVNGRITSTTYANLPSSPYDWQEVICTDCYTTTASNTGVRGMYNPTRKVWTDMLGNPLTH